MKPATFIALGSAYLVAIVLAPAGWLSEPGSGLLSLCLQNLSFVAPSSMWSAWSFAPAVTVPLAVAAGAYVLRVRELEQAEIVFFVCGFILLAAALVSPLCRLAAHLVSAHMIQHVILVALAPPLLVLGMGDTPTRWGSAISRTLLAKPGRCAVVYGVLIWFWHVPQFYEQALLDPKLHLLMYASLILAAMLFWTSLVSVRHGEASHGGWALLALLGTFVHTGLLGALLLFSSRLWYPLLAPTSATWGLSPLEDQQLAGLIMWVPMGAIYLLAALWVASGVLSRIGDVERARRPAAHDALIE